MESAFTMSFIKVVMSLLVGAVVAAADTATDEENCGDVKPSYYEIWCRELTGENGDILPYKIFVPEEEREVGPDDDLTILLFPLYKEAGLSGFYGYIGAVKCSESSENYVVIPKGPFTVADFDKSFNDYGEVIILDPARGGGNRGSGLASKEDWKEEIERWSRDEESFEDKQREGLPTRVFAGSVIKRELEKKVDAQLLPGRGYAGWDDRKLTAELRVRSKIKKLPVMDNGKSFLLVGPDIVPASETTPEKIPIREIGEKSKKPVEGGLPQNIIDVFIEVNEAVRITVNAEDVEASVLERAGESGIIAIAKISDGDPYYRPGFVVTEIKPLGGKITHVDNTELYSTVYFTSNWLPEYFRASAKDWELTVELDGKEVSAISGIKVGKEKYLSKGSVAIARPVKKGEKVTVKIYEEDSEGVPKEAFITITGEPPAIFGPVFKDERYIVAKVSAENDGGKGYVKMEADFKYYWFFGGWSRFRIKGDTVISGGPSASTDYVNARGEYLLRRLPVKGNNIVIETAGGGAGEIWLYPETEPSSALDEIFWSDLALTGAVTSYVGDLYEQKNFVRIETKPEFRYKLVRPELSPTGTDELDKYLFLPASLSYNYGGVQFGFEFAGTYIWNDVRTQVIDVSDGFHNYFSLVLTLSPEYVKIKNFPITLDSQSMFALNLKLENGRKPPLMNDISSRMSFEIEFAPNIGTKKEDGE